MMIKLSACIEMLFAELPFEQRPQAAADCGLPAIEFWGWANKNLPELNEACKKAGVAIAGCCVGTANEVLQKSWGKWGLLDRRNHSVLEEMLEETIEAVTIPYGIKTLILTIGQALPVPRWQQHASIVDGLKRVAPIAEKAGVTIVLEPLNPMVNHRGYYLETSYEGFDILRQVDSPAIQLLYDIYHQQITEGNLIENITNNIDLIGHIHVADVPGRNQPGLGEICYERVLSMLSASGYSGYTGLEYRPIGCSTADSLKHVKGIADSLSNQGV